jgi:hypothetical protein
MSDFSENPPKPVRGTEETNFPVPAQLPPLDRGINRKERLITLIAAAIIAALVSIVVIFGLRAFQGNITYGPEILEQQQLLKQHGTVTVSDNNSPAEVYYPVSYGSPPNLTIAVEPKGSVLIVEQKADHFKLKKNTSLNAVDVQWQAQGPRPAAK